MALPAPLPTKQQPASRIPLRPGRALLGQPFNGLLRTLILILAALPHSSLVGAWGREGHDRILQIAESLLYGYSPSKLDKVRKLMNGTLVSLANFENEIKEVLPNLTRVNWHHQKPEWHCSGGVAYAGDKGDTLKCDDSGIAEGSLFCAMAWFFQKYTHDVLLKAFPRPKVPIWDFESSKAGLPGMMPFPPFMGGALNFNATADVDALKNSTLDKAMEVSTALHHMFRSMDPQHPVRHKFNGLTPMQELRWLVMLVADLHQPLHLMHEYDYGEKLKVSYEGTEHTLLEFWEEVLPKRLAPLSHLMHRASERKDKWASHNKEWWQYRPDELFRTWAKEQSDIVCEQVYIPLQSAPGGGVIAATEGEDGGHTETEETTAAPAIVISEELIKSWETIVDNSIELAGQRTAFLLLDVLQHKRHKELHVKDGRGAFHKKKLENKHPLLTNLGIAAVEVPLVLFLLFASEKFASRVSLRSIMAGKKNVL